MLPMKEMDLQPLMLYHYEWCETTNLGEQQPQGSKTDTKLYLVDFISKLSAFWKQTPSREHYMIKPWNQLLFIKV